MYHAKDIGRNTYSYFTNAMNRNVSRRLSLEEQLHGALDRNEFTVFYQPQIEISSGNIVGTEALLRWHNPALGDITPNEFIPITEQNGLIIPIGKFVLSEALAMCAQWRNVYHDNFRIAVNLSPRQFRDTELVNFIKDIIKKTGLSGKHLELEITEGVLMSAHSYIDEVLNSLKKLGVSISMDDFGTGYSSLNYLRSYPFDVLKIDKTFINDIDKGKDNRELISATIAMAHKLNLKVVAEGVETKEQFTFLKELDCDYAQGFFLGKPMPGEKMTALLESVNSK
jgi:EAL domain-containing protein (putative c-di-GMP-specific phosphodiesterase class I)